MYTVADLMNPDVLTIDETDDLGLAASIFQVGRIRHLPVVDAEKRLVGVVTERDMLRAWATIGEAMGRLTRVAEGMTREVSVVMPGTPMRQALELMLARKFGCLPVVDPSDRQKVVGIVTEADAVRFAARIAAEAERLEEGRLAAPL
jgi:CBS domain-containing membrane protein